MREEYFFCYCQFKKKKNLQHFDIVHFIYSMILEWFYFNIYLQQVLKRKTEDATYITYN